MLFRGNTGVCGVFFLFSSPGLTPFAAHPINFPLNGGDALRGKYRKPCICYWEPVDARPELGRPPGGTTDVFVAELMDGAGETLRRFRSITSSGEERNDWLRLQEVLWECMRFVRGLSMIVVNRCVLNC